MSEETCSVCAEPVAPHTESYCNGCGRLFHLNQRSDRPGRDCGTVALSEAHLALEFLCAVCAEAADAPAELAAVLDLAEAARAAGMGEAALAAEAAAGRIPHRRTAGGALLFERAAVERLARAGGGAPTVRTESPETDEKLRTFAEMRDRGLLTNEEYEERRQRELERL